MVDNKLLFHMVAGAYISGKSFVEYAEEIADKVPLKNDAGLPIKGNKTFIAMANESHIKVNKFMQLAEQQLAYSNPDAIAAIWIEINRIEAILSKTIMLDEAGQLRVIGLINQLHKERVHIYDTEQSEA